MRNWAAGLAIVASCAVAAYVTLAPRGAMPPQDIPLPERPLPAARLQIVALGTSLTKNGVWPEGVADRLSRCLGVAVGVDRVAGVGANSDWGLGQVTEVAALKPDLALVEFAVNDADLLDGTSLGRSRQNLRGIIAALREARPGIAIALTATNPAHGPRGWLRPFLRRYSETLRVTAVAEGVGFFDGRARWQNDLRSGDIPDGLHPASAAEDRVIAPALATYLARSFGRDCR
jgi:lysophospholipase L1-like esterase